jgi:hypothetical protein
MSGPEHETATLNNISMFIAAIHGIVIEHPMDVDKKSLKPAILGQINKHGDIFLGKDDLLFLKKTFKILKTNRIIFDVN